MAQMSADSMGEAGGGSGTASTWRIEAAPPSISGQIKALWRYRSLLWPLSISALMDVYRGAILGVAWMAIIPLMITIPAVFIVGNVLGISVEPLPLPFFILVGLAIWTLFRRGMQWMTKGLTKGSSLFRRLYFPALLLLPANLFPGLFQFLVVMVLIAIVAIYYGPIADIYYLSVGWHTLAVVPSMLMMVLLAFAVSCFTSILNAFARDTWLTMRYVVGAWMLATPVVYPIEIIPETYRWMMYLNPATVPVELFRIGMLGYGFVPWPYALLSMAEIGLLVICGIWFFARMQNRLFDHM